MWDNMEEAWRHTHKMLDRIFVLWPAGIIPKEVKEVAGEEDGVVCLLCNIQLYGLFLLSDIKDIKDKDIIIQISTRN